MADDSSKLSIPAWQRAKQVESKAVKDDTGKETDDPGVEEAAGSEDATDAEESSPPESSTSQLDMVEAFLADPKVKDEPVEKRRAFLQSKEIPVETIDQVLKPAEKPTTAAFETADFQTFKQQQPSQPVPQQQPPPTSTAPPIITYPEFLLSAHRPAPLVTPTRALTATYLAAGIATLSYAATAFLLKPMTDALTEARHDFASHSQSKIDEFNERLEKIVSKIPEAKRHIPGIEVEDEEADSVTSDPTELYHRDMGTQTSPLPLPSSRRPSDPFVPVPPNEGTPRHRDPTTYQATGLGILSSHLSEILDGITDQQAPAEKKRREDLGKLRHYVDTMMYGGVGGGIWTQGEDGGGNGAFGRKEEHGKAVEALKREIRGVKGVLLSARRFPGVGRPGGAAVVGSS